ncbi:phosphate regulon sensor histidine kinase PhoR [Litoribacillus peritrichatus]|uniref:Phosphate regulon sensor protein PhoR n=1 Tax=Litoribacillus peritrichatus TaxID=718191 RepID=A0ABP7NCK8_9GAMM
MLSNWYIELQRVTLLVLATTLIGYLFGYPVVGLILGLIAYVVWTIRQMSRLESWLQHQELDKLPLSEGLWGRLFDSIYRQERDHQTAKRKLQTIINRIQQSTSALQDAVIMVESDGTLEWWNRSTEALLGFRTPVDGGQHITNLIRDPDFVEYFELGDYTTPLTLNSPINQSVALEMTITPFGNDERLITARDITHIEHLERMRKDFVANVSHELKTPLTVLIGYLETLIDYSDESDNRWLRIYHQMQSQAVRMQDLVHDLLILTRLETTEINVKEQPVNLKQLLEHLAAEARSFSNGRHEIQISAIDIEIDGCYDELSSAFSNLIFNAVKYTPEGGRVDITGYRDKTSIRVDVIDNGPGIDQKHIPHLTERFYRVDASRKSDTGGTGLGLAITKHILMRHNGHLLIESKLGYGSKFSCEFPLSVLSSGLPDPSN